VTKLITQNIPQELKDLAANSKVFGFHNIAEKSKHRAQYP